MTKQLKELLKNEEYSNQIEIGITFVDNATIRNLNRQYLNHDWETDVISFSLTDEYDLESSRIGDIYISFEQAQKQAIEYHVSEEEELIRLVIHGILHLFGYDHESPDEANIMRQKENDWLQQILLDERDY